VDTDHYFMHGTFHDLTFPPPKESMHAVGRLP